MTDFELEILRFLRFSDAPVLWCDLLNRYSPPRPVADVDAVLRLLLADGLVEKNSPSSAPPFCSLVLSESGLIQLIQEEEHRKHIIQKEQHKQQQSRAEARRAAEDHAAERKADQRFQITLSLSTAIFNVLANILLGALLSNLDRLIPWLSSFFH